MIRDRNIHRAARTTRQYKRQKNDAVKSHGVSSGLTWKAACLSVARQERRWEPPPTRDVNRDSGTRQPALGQLLGIAHRTMHVKFDHFKQRFSVRKLIPVNVTTLGDYLLLKRIEANLSQPELAVKSGVSVRKVKAWEHDHITPTEAERQVLAGILRLDSTYPKS